MIKIDKELLKTEINQSVQEFQKYSISTKSKIGKAILNGLLMIERSAKKIFRTRRDESIPNEPPRVQTGRLRNSVTHRMVSENEGEVGTNVEYGTYLEFGTAKMPPHPWLDPAYQENIEEINKNIDEATK